jgi:hypothetical protein
MYNSGENVILFCLRMMKTFGVVREENKKSTRKKMPKIRLFCPQYVTVMLTPTIPKWGPVSFIITDFNVFVVFRIN